ncbi:MAG: GNAT family N-acetyltransferase [Qingshengfaniella sp.]
MTPEALARIHAACFTTPPPWDAAAIADLLAGPGVFAVTDKAGFVLGRALAGEAELLTLAVMPEARRQGLGTRLLNGFETTARTHGATEAFLEVAADNHPAQTLYTTRGYDQIGRRTAYYRHPDGASVDALVLRRSLSAGSAPQR